MIPVKRRRYLLALATFLVAGSLLVFLFTGPAPAPNIAPVDASHSSESNPSQEDAQAAQTSPAPSTDTAPPSSSAETHTSADEPVSQAASTSTPSWIYTRQYTANFSAEAGPVWYASSAEAATAVSRYGTCHVEAAGVDCAQTVLSPRFENLRIQLVARQQSSRGGSIIRIAFAYRGATDFVAVDVREDKQFRIWGREGGETSTYLDWTMTSAMYSAWRWNRIQILSAYGVFEFQINDQVVASGTLSALPGQVALHVCGGSAEFTELVIDRVDAQR